MDRRIFVLLTSIVQDADGRFSERFFAVGEFSAIKPDYYGPKEIPKRLKARLVEVEIHRSFYSPPSAGSDTTQGSNHPVWEWLFPKADAKGERQGTRTRIRRVSPPIEMQA